MREDFARTVSRRTILRTVGVAGAAMTFSGVGSANCGTAETMTVTDDLLGPGDSDCWSLTFSESPCYVEITLDAADPDADFDLYVNAGSPGCPSRLFHDYAADTPDGEATVVISDPDPSLDSLSTLVFAESGSGEYTLTYEFHGP